MARRAASKRSTAKKKPAKSGLPRKTAAARKAGTGKAKGTGKGKPKAAQDGPERIEVRNVNVPGYRNTVDAAKYGSMRSTLFAFLPRAPPGMTQAEMMEAARAKADPAHFPGGEKSEWWMKTVQLDQEARGAMKRSDTKPLRWWRS